MSDGKSEYYLGLRLKELSLELEKLSHAAKPESANYMSLEDTFEHINAMYNANTKIDVELISMQSGLHANTIRRLFTKREAFYNAKLTNLQRFLDVLGISLWGR